MKYIFVLFFPLMMYAQDTTLIGDVDCSGDITSQDAVLILQYVTSVIDELPCESNMTGLTPEQLQEMINMMDEQLSINYTGVSGGGCDYKWPEGLYGEPVFIDLLNDNYIVPEGKHLYITSAYHLGGNARVMLNNVPVFSAADSSLPYTSPNVPIVINSGDVLSAESYNPTTTIINVIGILINQQLIEPVFIDLLNDNYIVPEGKHLYITSAYHLGGNARVMLNNVPVFSAADSSLPNTSPNVPIVINSGDVLSAESYNPTTTIINVLGYLADEDYFADCSGGGDSTINSAAGNGVTSTSLSNYNNSYDIITLENLPYGSSENSTHVIETDLDGNIYVLGSYYPTHSYSEALNNLLNTGDCEINNSSGIYLAKYNSSGDFVGIFSQPCFSSISPDGSSTQNNELIKSFDLDFDSNGDILILSYVQYSWYRHQVLFKISQNLDVLIEEKIITDSYSPTNISEMSIDIDSSDNIYISGSAYSGTDTQQSPVILNTTITDLPEVIAYTFPFLAKLNSNLSPIWIVSDFITSNPSNNNVFHIRKVFYDEFGINVFNSGYWGESSNALVNRFDFQGNLLNSLIIDNGYMQVWGVHKGIDKTYIFGTGYQGYSAETNSPTYFSISNIQVEFPYDWYNEFVIISINNDLTVENINLTGVAAFDTYQSGWYDGSGSFNISIGELYGEELVLGQSKGLDIFNNGFEYNTNDFPSALKYDFNGNLNHIYNINQSASIGYNLEDAIGFKIIQNNFDNSLYFYSHNIGNFQNNGEDTPLNPTNGINLFKITE